MNVGNIVTPNTKGQIVIPNHLRKSLGITDTTLISLKLMGQGIYLQPVTAVAQLDDNNQVFLDILAKTAGSFADDPNFTPESLKKRRKFELARARKNKQAW